MLAGSSGPVGDEQLAPENKLTNAAPAHELIARAAKVDFIGCGGRNVNALSRCGVHYCLLSLYLSNMGRRHKAAFRNLAVALPRRQVRGASQDSVCE